MIQGKTTKYCSTTMYIRPYKANKVRLTKYKNRKITIVIQYETAGEIVLENESIKSRRVSGKTYRSSKNQ